MEIEAHVQMCGNAGAERADQEFLGRAGRELARERKGDHRIDAGLREHLQALLVRHELAETLSMEHLIRIDVERERDGLPAVFARGILRTRQKEPMAPMHAIEHAERARGALEIPAIERFVGLKDLRHEAPPFGTRSMP